jgi:GTP pyrophosphokinase
MEAAADGDGQVPEDYEDLVIAALLHDVVEDCGGSPRLEDVRRRFGERVASVVDHCTDAKPDPGKAKPPWADRKRAYIQHLHDTDDIWAVMVSAADKIHNARSIVADLRTVESSGAPQDAFWLRFVKSGRQEDVAGRVPQILWYYESLCEAIEAKASGESDANAAGRIGRLAREFRAVVSEMQALAGKAGHRAASP